MEKQTHVIYPKIQQVMLFTLRDGIKDKKAYLPTFDTKDVRSLNSVSCSPPLIFRWQVFNTPFIKGIHTNALEKASSLQEMSWDCNSLRKESDPQNEEGVWEAFGLQPDENWLAIFKHSINVSVI